MVVFHLVNPDFITEMAHLDTTQMSTPRAPYMTAKHDQSALNLSWHQITINIICSYLKIYTHTSICVYKYLFIYNKIKFFSLPADVLIHDDVSVLSSFAIWFWKKVAEGFLLQM